MSTAISSDGVEDRVARAIALSIAQQDYTDAWKPAPDWDFTWAYIDQGTVDFRKVARAAIAAISAEGDE